MTPRHLKNRVEFCKIYSQWPIEEIRKVMFTDEATFYVSDGNNKMVWKSMGDSKAENSQR